MRFFSQTFVSAVCPPTFSRKPGAVLFARVLTLLLLAAGMAWPVEVRAQSAMQHEYEIKAAYIYHFINYIDWPANALPPPGGTLTIGIVGENPFSAAFDPLNGKQVKGRTLAVKQITAVQDANSCQIIFIFASETSRLKEILDQFKELHVVTVGEIDGFAAHGGIINFISESNKVRFEINPDAAKRLGLSISSELLKLAKLVKS